MFFKGHDWIHAIWTAQSSDFIEMKIDIYKFDFFDFTVNVIAQLPFPLKKKKKRDKDATA